MLTWFMTNLGTIVVTFILVLIVACILFKLVRDKKQGRSSCGGNCAGCSSCGSCRCVK
ncbi:MAG: FeoB-associated Cys-rich membrane protein [Lachnospiraceae bacterium]|nr:FeoB-associated Cys-rich membrane protein [Lachnospiraceae bacterium]